MAEGKKRHGCLTAWLVLMIVASSLSALMYLFASDRIRQNLPNAPAWAFPALVVLCAGNVVFSVALFQWKKWGFFGCIATSILAVAVNLAVGVGIVHVILGLAGTAILYGVLQIGGEKKGWAQLG